MHSIIIIIIFIDLMIWLRLLKKKIKREWSKHSIGFQCKKKIAASKLTCYIFAFFSLSLNLKLHLFDISYILFIKALYNFRNLKTLSGRIRCFFHIVVDHFFFFDHVGNKNFDCFESKAYEQEKKSFTYILNTVLTS